ncbi:MAG: hypothetical protein HYZ00_01125 [Candidatus Hydrogenedentes bacterium]|nr:hypothetical protein [Candidatus Hydrogenedentota bacterium]
MQSVNPARRELRVACSASAAPALARAEWVYVRAEMVERALRCRVESARATAAEVILRLVPGVPRDTVAGFRRAELGIECTPRAQEPTAALKAAELVGMTLFSEAEGALGTIVEVMQGPAQDVLVAETPAGQRVLLPAVPEVIQKVDRAAARVVVGDIGPFAVVEGKDGEMEHED